MAAEAAGPCGKQQTGMTIADGEVGALLAQNDRLEYSATSRTVSGILVFNACWLPDDEELLIGLRSKDQHRLSLQYIEDQYAVTIELERLTEEGYPAVTLQDGKVARMIERLKVAPEDLHLTRQGHNWDCCLSLGEPSAADLPLPEFVYRLVIPFLYRLSYAQRHGLNATRRDLWPEYSHGTEGLEERLAEHQSGNAIMPAITADRIEQHIKEQRAFEHKVETTLARSLN